MNYYLAGLYFGAIHSAGKYVSIKFILMNNIRSCFIVAHSALL